MKVALGGAAAAAVGAVARPAAAGADDGGAVLLGMYNKSTQPTTINSPTSEVTLAGNAGYTILAEQYADNANSIETYTTGNNGVGMLSVTTGNATQTGVRGDATSNAGNGIGVHGISQNGVGVLAECPGGYALWVKGRAQFTRSGKLKFAKGQAAKAVTPMVFNQDSLVIGTIQGNVAGVYVQGVVVDIAHSKFTINLNKPAPVALTVGWFIAN